MVRRYVHAASGLLVGGLLAGLVGASPDCRELLCPWRAPDPVTVMLGTCLWQLYLGWLAVTVLLAVRVRAARALPLRLVTAVEEAARAGDCKTAEYLARLDGSCLGRVLAAGLAHLDDGLEEARAASWRAGLRLREAQEKPLLYLEVIGTLGPLLGLLAAVRAAVLQGQ